MSGLQKTSRWPTAFGELSRSYGMFSTAIVLALAVLLLDVSFPLGVAAGVPYVAAVMVGLWFPNRLQILMITVICVALTVAGYFLSPIGGEDWVVLINRGMALFAILVTGSLLYSFAEKPNRSSSAVTTDAEFETWNSLKVLGPWSIGISLLTLLSVLVISFYVNKETERSQQWVAHTRHVQADLSEVLSLLQDSETGQRGFLLTGDEKYLEPFDSAVGRIAADVSELKFLTKDNPSQQDKIKFLEPLIDQKIAELRETISLRRTEGFESALALVNTDIGKTVMDQIRVVISVMSEEEALLLAQRQSRFDKLRHIAMAI